MINNRQNGRRRGRGGGPRTPNAPGNGNRQDNRSRGNASQLHEKYKALARDAQLAGDRVQTEYYLQFADHYFRVLNENRPRFEEQRRGRDDFASDEDEDQDEAVNAADADEQDEGEEAQGNQRRGADQEQRSNEQRNGEQRPRRQRRRRSDEEAEAGADAGDERISVDSLPPAISAVESGDEAKPAPRRRTRRPRNEEGEAEIAPAA